MAPVRHFHTDNRTAPGFVQSLLISDRPWTGAVTTRQPTAWLPLRAASTTSSTNAVRGSEISAR